MTVWLLACRPFFDESSPPRIRSAVEHARRTGLL